MAVYWMTEALPLAITSLLPVVLFPLLGIMDTGKVCTAYMKVGIDPFKTNKYLHDAIFRARRILRHCFPICKILGNEYDVYRRLDGSSDNRTLQFA